MRPQNWEVARDLKNNLITDVPMMGGIVEYQDKGKFVIGVTYFDGHGQPEAKYFVTLIVTNMEDSQL